MMVLLWLICLALIALVTQVSSFNIDLDTQPIKYINATGVFVPIRFKGRELTGRNCH